MKTLIVQNYWTPYRHELFSELSRKADIAVLYLGEVGNDRLWKKEETSFESIQLKAKKRGPFLFSDLSSVDLNSFDQLVVLEHLENIFTILKLVKHFKGRFFLWTGMGIDTHPDKPGYDRVLNFFKRFYRRRLYRANHFLAYCGLTREMLQQTGVADGDITIIHQASQIEIIPEIANTDPVSLRTGREKGPLRLLSLGYLRSEKNNEFLVKVCGRFTPEELQLIIVGDGPEKDRLESLNTTNTQIKGYLKGYDKFKAYLDADIFVLPTIRDPWALVINEAMYYGLPILCSDRAGARDVVRDNGFLFDPFDEEDLYQKIRKLLDSREQLPHMGTRSREIISEYSIEFAAGQLASILNGEK